MPHTASGINYESRAGSASFHQRRTARCCSSGYSFAALTLFAKLSLSCLPSQVSLFLFVLIPGAAENHTTDDATEGKKRQERFQIGCVLELLVADEQEEDDGSEEPEYSTCKCESHSDLLSCRRNVQQKNDVRLWKSMQGQAI